MKIRQLGAELFMRTDGQTDMTKLIVAFHNFANPPKKWNGTSGRRNRAGNRDRLSG